MWKEEMEKARKEFREEMEKRKKERKGLKKRGS